MPYRIVPGAVVDGFVVGPRVHSGAMGNIFSVAKEGLAGTLIMKVPKVGTNQPPEGIISFETEATVLPALRGPHVPRVLAVGDLARTPYLVIEWIEGLTLEDIVRGGALPPVEVARIGAAMADALHSIHEQEAIHLDLKPANVILKRDGTAALIDFGFAHHARFPDLLAEETRFGAGSKAYVSPEQIRGTREDPRSDLFSLGVVMYEMATGELPFDPDTDVRNRLWLDPIPPVCHAPPLPAWLQEVILRCLEADAEKRYQSAAHVAFDLRNPEQLALTARSRKCSQSKLSQRFGRFYRAWRERADRRPPRPPALPRRPPIVMVAVDTNRLDDERQPAIRRATAEALSMHPEYRIVCVSVIPTPPLIDGPTPAETASGLHLEHLVRLRRWVEPLNVPMSRLSLHAIESARAPEALLEFANRNHVDLIVLGAPGPTHSERTWWDSVASTVTANAQCSVHVVRVGR